MTTLTITRGLPGAGKTFWAKSYANAIGGVRVNRDDVRVMMYDRKVGLSHEQEGIVNRMVKELVKLNLQAGRDVVADEMNLRPSYVREWRKMAVTAGAEFVIKEFHITPQASIDRQWSRPYGDRVPADVIRGMVERYMPKCEFLPVSDEAEPIVPDPYVPDPTKPRAFICDIDGTIALMGSRNPYDLTKVLQDDLNLPVAGIVEALMDGGRYGEVIYLSGRDESSRELTQLWLKRHWMPSGQLFMRPEGDTRRDSIVKRELFDQHVRHNYKVEFVLDDRNQVVEMWRALGLTCLQVAPGDF